MISSIQGDIAQMNWERRPKEDEPAMVQRIFRDDDGRTWTGSVTSGRLEGGEDFAEVLFVCNDQPAETKRVATLEFPPGEADRKWKLMADDEVTALFNRSEPA
jgi:sulfate adenylyltransferase subunit 1 (EFTu-like GTPase family)